ncbi:MAG: flagellar motor switch protein FliN [Pseudomonadota bacterium]|nr:flagellar motor switch protein FliN [Pseudomonadota bacterium]
MTDANDSDQSQAQAEDAWAEAMAEQAGDKKATEEAATVATEGPADAAPQADPLPTATFDSLTDDGGDDDSPVNLDVILDVPVTLSMEIGRTRISIRNLLQLNQGSVLELDRLAGESLDVLVNGTLIAHGEVVVLNERYGIRLTDVISPAERVKKLR